MVVELMFRLARFLYACDEMDAVEEKNESGEMSREEIITSSQAFSLFYHAVILKFMKKTNIDWQSFRD